MILADISDISTWIIGALSGGGVIIVGKAIEWYMNIRKQKVDSEIALDEQKNKTNLATKAEENRINIAENEQAMVIYRGLVEKLQCNVDKLMADIDKMQEEHIRCREENISLRQEVKMLTENQVQLKAQIEKLSGRLDNK